MSDMFIGEIQMFAGNFAPRPWAFCDGQLLDIASHTALFSILGTVYGGDGRTTFRLPWLQGRVPMHAGSGTGPGLTHRPLGQGSGTELAYLSLLQIPNHNHTPTVGLANGAAVNGISNGQALSNGPAVNIYDSADDVTNKGLGGVSTTFTGSGIGHENMMPVLAVNFIILMQGIYPSRN